MKWGTWAVTVTPQQIERAWAKRRGLANIAVSCGPSNLVVLDEDAHSELDRWCVTHGVTLPHTYTVTTGRGRHLYFRHDHTVAQIGNSPKAMTEFKIDVRGHGGFVIGAGSRHASGATYAGDETPIAELPAQVAELLLAGAHSTNGEKPQPGKPVWETVSTNGEDPNTAKIGYHKRHDALVAYAGRLRGMGLDHTEALPVFRQRWLLCEQPEGQVPEATFHSAECPCSDPNCPFAVTWQEAAAKLRDVYGRYPAGHTLAEADATGVVDGEVAGEAVDDDHIRAFKFPDGQRPTDVGNAARLLRHNAGRIRYVREWGKWIVYQRGRWIIDEKDALVTEAAKRVAKGLFVLASKTANEAEDPKDAGPIWQWAMHSDTSGAIAAMIRLARGAPGILVDHEDLDADPWLLNVANATIDLRTGALRDHEPADLCTLQAPVAYDPHATAPLWEACVARWQPGDDVRAYVQVRAGVGATGIPTETVDVDYGLGGNGKSKFHGAIQHVLGPYATVPHKSLLVAGRFEQHPTVVADLFRKRLAVASETKQAEDLDDESVKNLTGGDRLTARRMREDPWGFWPTHTLIMFSNHKPTVAGRDEGIWRRLRLVPWNVTIPENERDEHLAAKLAAEAPGILRWIVDGAVRFHREGLDPPPAVRTATAAYRAEEDVVGRFVDEVLTFAPHTWCFSIDIKNELDDWCAEQDIETPPRMNEVTATLRAKGASEGGRRMIHGKRSTIWHGVSVTQTSGEKQ